MLKPFTQEMANMFTEIGQQTLIGADPNGLAAKAFMKGVISSATKRGLEEPAFDYSYNSSGITRFKVVVVPPEAPIRGLFDTAQ